MNDMKRIVLKALMAAVAVAAHAQRQADSARAWDNLALLLSLAGPEHVIVRVPQIAECNTEADCARTAARLGEMGVGKIDRFTYRVK
ncbi:MAG: hypothetical protein J6I49_08290 [Bacteroidales bacterium]|nr:hypothetical protein [Bacteroidales bacterium]